MIDKLKSMIGRKFLVLAISVPLLVLDHIAAREFLIICLAYMGANLGEHILSRRKEITLSQKSLLVDKEAIDV